MKSRRIKVLRFTNKHHFSDIEHDVNAELDALSKAKYSIINIQSIVVSTTTPTFVLYTITYEGEFSE